MTLLANYGPDWWPSRGNRTPAECHGWPRNSKQSLGCLHLEGPQELLIHGQYWGPQFRDWPVTPCQLQACLLALTRHISDLQMTLTQLQVWAYQPGQTKHTTWGRLLEGEMEPRGPNSSPPSSATPPLSHLLSLEPPGESSLAELTRPDSVLVKRNRTIGENEIHSSLFTFSKKCTLLNVRCSLATETWARGKSLSPKCLGSPRFRLWLLWSDGICLRFWELNFQAHESWLGDQC